MSPRRPRRRARRRSPARPVILLVAAVIVLAFIVGGLTQVSRQSQGYDANSDRSLAAQGTVVADQSNATSSTVRALINGLQSQSRQGLQAELDSAVQQTADESSRASLAAGSSPLGSVATEFADRLRRAGPIHDAAACRRRRVPRYATPLTSRGASRRRRGDHRLSRLALGDPGDEPHRRSRRTPVPLRCALPVGAAVSCRRRRPWPTSPVGVGDRPAALAARQRGDPGRSPRHLVHSGGDARRRPAHRALEPPGPARAAGRRRRACRCSVPRPSSA